MNKEIVIAASFRDLKWTEELNDSKITVYRKGAPIKNDKEIKIDINKGVAEHTNFYHIVNNYENLSNMTFFVQDFPFDHWGNVIEIVNTNSWKEKCNLNINNGYFGFHNNNLGTSWNLINSTHFTNGTILKCFSNGDPQHSFTDNLNLDMFWNIIFDEPKPEYYEFIPGTHFGITKEQIHIRSKNFYRYISDLLISNKNVPHIIERLHCYIFDERFKTIL